MIRRSLTLASLLLALCFTAQALERQSPATYHHRREALAESLHGGAALLYAADEPILDFLPYRQDSDFYYLTGWNEPGAALLIFAAGDASHSEQKYQEILLLPTRNLHTEKYTGVKMDASTPDAAAHSGVEEVLPLKELVPRLNQAIEKNRSLLGAIYTQPGNPNAAAVLQAVANSLGISSATVAQDATAATAKLRIVKDEGELALMQKAMDASISAQLVMIRSVHPGVTERAVAGKIIAELMAGGCERPSYAPIVGSGINSTVLHYSENSGTMQSGDVAVVDAAGEYSMYASDITRTVPINGHFTARQRHVYEIVLGAQQAAAKAFVAGVSKLNDREHQDPDSLDSAAWNYIHDHDAELAKYWVHGLGHMIGIDVHDPAQYPAVLRPGMTFTIEPGVYIPEEKLGIRIEDVFVVQQDGSLRKMTAALPSDASAVEALMKP
jgi:Xaa-Pro aminopeptidase